MAGKEPAEVRVAGFPSTFVGAWELRDLPSARRELPQLVRAAYRGRVAFVLWTDHDPRAIIAPVDVASGRGRLADAAEGDGSQAAHGIHDESSETEAITRR